MKQIAWYAEGWDQDDDDFDKEPLAWCDTCKEENSVPVNPRRLEDARDRRLVLIENGQSTYEINTTEASIVCLCCGMLSSNLHDIEYKYCGFCHSYHTEKLSHDPDL